MNQDSVWEFSYGAQVCSCFLRITADRKTYLMLLQLKLFNQYFSKMVQCYSSCHPIKVPVAILSRVIISLKDCLSRKFCTF